MNSIYEQVNAVISKWDPLNVGPDLASDEYRAFIPRLVRNIGKRENLRIALEEILLKEMKCDFQQDDPIHIKSIEDLCDELNGLVDQ
jgi:hypothetical protein